MYKEERAVFTTHCICSECRDFLYKGRSVFHTPVHIARCDPVHLVRCCDCLYKEERSVYSIDTSACYLHLVTLKLSFTCTSPSIKAGMECTFNNTAASGMRVLLTRLACTLFDTVGPSGQHHSVNSTDTSTCYHHLVSWTDTSACYLHLSSRARASRDMLAC